MQNIQTNNSLSFLSSKNILAEKAIGTGKKLKKPVHEMLSQSQLRIATEELLQDLNGMTIPVSEEVKNAQIYLAEQASKVSCQKFVEQKANNFLK